MAEQTDPPRPHGDPFKDELIENRQDNRAQRDSDATPDATAEPRGDRLNNSESNANGVPEFDEADAERRRKLYDEGADSVSRID